VAGQGGGSTVVGGGASGLGTAVATGAALVSPWIVGPVLTNLLAGKTTAEWTAELEKKRADALALQALVDAQLGSRSYEPAISIFMKA
jgi:hypothetical protein